MRKVLTFLGASLCLALVVPAMAQTAPDQFKDVPTDHWAYQAVEDLRAKNIVIGYPDGYFRGKRTLTRYEFAVALKRALDQVATIKGDKGDPGAAGAQGPQGEAGPAGAQGPSGVAPDELENLKKLAAEFKAELASMGVNLNAVKAGLDKLSKEVADLRGIVEGMPKVSGTAFIGVRVDRAAGNYVDKDGRELTDKSLVNSAAVVHAFELGVTAKVGGDATVHGSLITDNYLSYLGGTTTYTDGPWTADQSNTYINKLEIKAPFGGVGRDGSIVLGRQGIQATPLTLQKPDVDTYFKNPLVDDAEYRMDGLTLSTKLGSLGLNVFAGSTRSVSTDDWYGIAAPIVGIGGQFYPGEGGASKPYGIWLDEGMMVDQLAGVSVKMPVKAGEDSHLRVTALEATGSDGDGFTNVAVVGADTKLNLSERVSVQAEWAKSMLGTGKKIANVTNSKNNAFNGAVSFGAGKIGLSAGYKYVDPMYYAPGYWGRIGNWINPTNVQGPTVRAKLPISESFGLTAGGDFMKGARNMAGVGGLSTDDNINRVLVGMRWDISKAFQTTVDWEGVYWSLNDDGYNGYPSSPSGKVHPTEHYITIGTGLALNETTQLKLGYQMGTFNGKNFLYGGDHTGSYSFNVFTSQVAIKF